MVLFHPDLTLGAMEDEGGAQGMDMLGFPGHRGSLLFWLTVYFVSVMPAF